MKKMDQPYYLIKTFCPFSDYIPKQYDYIMP